MRGLNRKSSGQSSLLDALIFFAIAMLASLMLTYASFPGGQTESKKMTRVYCKSTLDSYLRSTINHTSYRYQNETVHLDDKTISELVVEDLYLRSHTDIGNESLTEIERGLNRTLQRLTVSRYYYNFTARAGNASFTCQTYPIEGQEITSTTQILNTPDDNQTYLVILKIWPV